MTDHANPWLLAFLVAGCAVCALVIVVPLWRHRRRSSEPERTELDNSEPLVRVERVNTHRRKQ